MSEGKFQVLLTTTHFYSFDNASFISQTILVRCNLNAFAWFQMKNHQISNVLLFKKIM